MWANTAPDGGMIAVGVADDGKLLGCLGAGTTHMNRIESDGGTRAYFLPVFIPIAAWALWRQPDRHRLLVFVSVACYAAYVLAVGGDRFEFRFWIPILPLSYWLVTDAVERLDLSRTTTTLATAVLIAARCTGRSRMT